jgi:putative ABC transport system ATP-binding protein
MIQLKKIYKYYNSGSKKAYVLSDVSLDIAEGEFVSIMGPSGSGAAYFGTAGRSQ